MSPEFYERFANTLYDVIIVGGGINGSGIARDLALRGVSVLLLSDSDPIRASRNNSHLGHGGLRYLENLDFSLVFSSRQEINRLLYNAPHLVRPLSMLIPVFAGDKYPLWQLKLGMAFYDGFVEKGRLPRHQILSAQQVRTRLPWLSDERSLKGGVLYYDTQIAYPDRLCLENLLDAEAQSSSGQPVLIHKHARVTGITETEAGVSVQFTNLLDASEHQAKGLYVVNAAGHHVDKLIQGVTSEQKPAEPLMGPTKGTHIIIDNAYGLKDTVYSPSRIDGRPFFIIPFPVEQPHNQLLIGTTDDKQWQSNYPEAQEITYLIDSTRCLFSEWEMKNEDVIQAFSGFRPLPASNKKEGKITRRHILHQQPKSRIIHVIGGKLTTYRLLSQEVGDKVLKALGRPSHPRMTEKRPLPGAVGIDNLAAFKSQVVPQTVEQFGVSPEIADHLIDRYGALFSQVLSLTVAKPTDPISGPRLKENFTSSGPFIKAQIVYAIRAELAETLMDFMVDCLQLDRLPGAGMDGVETVLGFLAQEKQLSRTKQLAMREEYEAYIAHQNAWRHGQ